MRRLIAIVLVFALLGAGGCAAKAPEEDPEVLAVRSAVRTYNDALVRAFAEMDMNELNTVATEEQATKEFYLMAALGESRVRMIGVLRSIEFGEVTFTGDASATVTTTETWDYRHESLDTSETVREETGIVYRLRYDLVLQNGRWLVDAVTSLDETTPSEETSTP